MDLCFHDGPALHALCAALGQWFPRNDQRALTSPSACSSSAVFSMTGPSHAADHSSSEECCTGGSNNKNHGKQAVLSCAGTSPLAATPGGSFLHDAFAFKSPYLKLAAVSIPPPPFFFESIRTDIY
jgi:hypothetical protein